MPSAVHWWLQHEAQSVVHQPEFRQHVPAAWQVLLQLQVPP
jgi:hypothetical protein